MFTEISRRLQQTARARRQRHTLGIYREVFSLQRSIGLEANRVAATTQVNERASTGANWTALQTLLIEPYRAKVLAITAILPPHLDWRSGLAFKIQFPQNMAAILTLDRALSRSKETLFVFWAEYSHSG